MDSSQLPDMTAQNRGPAPQFSTLAFRLRDPEQHSTHATASVLSASSTAMDTSQPIDWTMGTAKRRKIAHHHSENPTNSHAARHTPQLTNLALRPRLAEQTIAQTPNFVTSLALRSRHSEQPTAPSLWSGTESHATASVVPILPSRDTQANKSMRGFPIILRNRQSFRTLTSELQLRIMSYLSLKDLAALRQTCREVHSIISASEEVLARPFIEQHLNRLQTTIDVINSAKMPTDVDTLLASMRLWTFTRGCFRDPDVSLESWYKWFSHLANGDIKSPAYMPFSKDFEQWAHVARVATSLQRKFNAANPSMVDLWDWFVAEIALHPSPLDHTALAQLYTRIQGAQNRHYREISGRWRRADLERATFPSVAPNRYRLTPIRHKLVDDPGKSCLPLYPAHKVEIMLGPLGLPRLPPHNTFCYYTKKHKLVGKLTKVHSGAAVMPPLMRAKALEWVELF